MTTLAFHIPPDVLTDGLMPNASIDAGPTPSRQAPVQQTSSATDPHPDLLDLSGWGRRMVRELEAFLSGALSVANISRAEVKKQGTAASRGRTTHAEYEPC
jgi:hypothetical protein